MELRVNAKINNKKKKSLMTFIVVHFILYEYSIFVELKIFLFIKM